MKKFLIISLSLLLIVLLALASYVAKKHQSIPIKQSCVVDISYDRTGRIMLPMTVDNHTELFLWDSGASGSVVFNTSGAYSRDSAKMTILSEKQTRNLPISNFADVSLGDFDFKSPFIFYNHYVIGRNIINNFYWYFNFVDNKCEISNTPIKIAATNSMIKLTLNFDKLSKSAVCNLTFDDRVSARFLFDTGHSSAVVARVDNPGGREKILASFSYDMIITSRDSTSKGMTFLKDMIENPKIQGIQSRDKRMFGIIANSAKINNIYMTVFLQYEEDFFYDHFDKENVIGIITNKFIRRFDMMYYSHSENKIELYCSRDKIPLLLGAEIYKYLDPDFGGEYPYKVKNPYNKRPHNSWSSNYD